MVNKCFSPGVSVKAVFMSVQVVIQKETCLVDGLI